MDPVTALELHAHWMVQFRLAISNHESMDVPTISDDNCCEIGKWLHGDAKTNFGHLAIYTKCVAKHAEFHVEAGKIVSAINEQKYAEAEDMLQPRASYASSSRELGVALITLKSEIG